MHICDVFKPSTNVWYIFQASTGDFPAVCVGRGGGINVKLICQGTQQCIFVMYSSLQTMFGIYFWLFPVIFLLQVGG